MQPERLIGDFKPSGTDAGLKAARWDPEASADHETFSRAACISAAS